MNQRNIDSVGGGVNSHNNIFNEIVGLDNLFSAWLEFRRGKRKKRDVQEFEFSLEDNLFELHEELRNKTYKHSAYQNFYVRDPKLRHIHKACVYDRIIHQAVFRKLYPVFDKTFIFDSYSCRFKKGTHKAVLRLGEFARKLSKNYKRNIFALKCDVRKFFENIDHGILLAAMTRHSADGKVLWLLSEIIESFHSKNPAIGLPLGNVTSQLFANIYLNELDQFVKRELKEKYYIRYCDDFVILGGNREHLLNLIPQINKFLKEKLCLELHGSKISVRKFSRGIDFLGYVVLPFYRVLRTKTKRRIIKKIAIRSKEVNSGLISPESFNQSLQSYLGTLKHCRGFKIKQRILNII